MRFFFTIILLSQIAFSLNSQTRKIKDLEGQRKLVLKEISTTTQLLNNTKKSAETILERINLLSKQINSRSQVILLLNQEIDLITKEQADIEKSIEELESSLKEEKLAYAKAIEGVVARKHDNKKLLYILSGKSFSESLRRLKYLKDYSKWRENQAELIRQKQLDLHEKEANLNKTKIEKMSLLSTRQKEQAQLQTEEQIHQKEVKEANEKQKELQGLLVEKQKKANVLNAQIQKLIAEEVARQEREAKRLAAEQEKKRKAAELAAKEREKHNQAKPAVSVDKDDHEVVKEVNGSKTTYATTENVKMSSNFAANKGKLPMPISGRPSITSRFGVHHHDRWNVSTNNNGIDIESQPGAQARAVFNGEVSRIIAFPGFNNCIIIRHGGYYTFYGNIQQVTVKQGQKVTTNQVLGSVYTDTDTNSSMLHFQLWQGTTKLNPELWIRR